MPIENKEIHPGYMKGSRLIPLSDVMALTGMSRATIYRAMKNSLRFPVAVKIGARTAWRLDEVEEWMNNRPRMSGNFEIKDEI